MKFRLLFLLLWASIPMFSQIPIPPGLPDGIEINSSFGNEMNLVFSNLDKSKVPNGLLQDFAMESSSLEAYSGTLADSTYVHSGTLKQLYSTLLMSRITSNTNEGFVSYQNFENNWKDEREKNVITMSGLYFKYSKFIDGAYPDKITISNNKLYDKYVNGVWQNPYEEERVFAIAPSVINYDGLNFSAKFPSNLWYTNDSSSIQNIQIDFADGNGYVNVNPGQQLSVSYTTEGVKTWTYKIFLATGEILFSHSKLNFNRTPNNCAYGTGGVNNCSIETIQISSSKTFNNSHGSATLQIDYGNVYGEIRRPIIVAEGLDIGAVTKPESPFGESDLTSFLSNAYNSFSGPLINQLIGNISIDNDQEYDIIYVNWDNGSDYIQRNAYALEAVIEWVNNQKTTTEKNIVIGQSMGGLVARYALKDMEDDNLQHDTKLFVSQDSPHLGANIPLGYQYAARNARKQYIQSPVQLFGGDVVWPLFNDGVGASDYLDLLDQPAVKQMLVQWVNKSYIIDNSAHNNWQILLKNKGYPQLTKNVAISNGNQCANTQGFDPGDTLFSVDGRVKTGWLTDIFTSFTGIGNVINSRLFFALTIFTFEPGFLTGVLPGNSKLNADIHIRSLPNQGQTSQIYSADITFTKKVLWLINITTTIVNKNFNSPAGTLPYDYYPGGVVSTGIPPSNTSKSNALYGLNINVVSDPDFVLIPTVSALDIGGGFTVLDDSDYFGIYASCSQPPSTGSSSFVNYISGKWQAPRKIQELEVDGEKINIYNYNQRHLDLFPENGDWLAKEIDPDLPLVIDNCSVTCESLEISGPDSFCQGSSFEGVLKIPTTLSDISSINWLVPNYPVFIRSGQGTEELHLSFFSPGSATIGVDITLNTGAVLHLEKYIYSEQTYNSDSPNISVSPSNPNNLICCNTSGYYNVEHAVINYGYSLNNSIEWEWTVHSQNSNDVYGFSEIGKTAVIGVQKHTYSPLIVSARARTKNDCGGTSSWSNEISRYYGTVSGSSYNVMASMVIQTGNNAVDFSNENLPLDEYYLQDDKTLTVNYLDTSEWLDYHYSNKNLSDKEVERIVSILNTPEELELIIYDFRSNPIYSEKITPGLHTIDLSHLFPGIYIVKYTLGENIYTRKFIKDNSKN
ncbi:MAG: T9SS type A sorting domain-containing protein [Salinimicrobium sp.]